MKAKNESMLAIATTLGITVATTAMAGINPVANSDENQDGRDVSSKSFEGTLHALASEIEDTLDFPCSN